MSEEKNTALLEEDMEQVDGGALMPSVNPNAAKSQDVQKGKKNVISNKKPRLYPGELRPTDD